MYVKQMKNVFKMARISCLALSRGGGRKWKISFKMAAKSSCLELANGANLLRIVYANEQDAGIYLALVKATDYESRCRKADEVV